MNKVKLTPKEQINPKDYDLGVVIMRLQVHELHPAHVAILDMVCSNHKKVILFLGVPVVENTKRNPLNFATRASMVRSKYPNIIILPQKDQRSDEKWSNNLDDAIRTPFGELPALLYGSRDSFIPHYTGKHAVMELTSDVFYSGTEIRREVSREILASADFRAGIIHATYAQRPCTYPTVDIVAFNEKGQLLLAKKPNETKYRFIGGFVDRTDENWEQAAKREFMEETGGCEIGDLKYVTSNAVNDWRYAKDESGIMTTLFIGKFIFGAINPSDDIAMLAWVDVSQIITLKDNLESFIMLEHVPLMKELLRQINNNKFPELENSYKQLVK